MTTFYVFIAITLLYAIWWDIPNHLRDIASELKRMNDLTRACDGNLKEVITLNEGKSIT